MLNQNQQAMHKLNDIVSTIKTSNTEEKIKRSIILVASMDIPEKEKNELVNMIENVATLNYYKTL